MLRNIVSKLKRIPEPLGIGILITGAVIITVAVLFLFRPFSNTAVDKSQAVQPQAAGDVAPLAARVDRLDGEVGIAGQTDVAGQTSNPTAGPVASPETSPDAAPVASDPDFIAASVNSPVSVGSRIFVKDASKAAIAFSGRNYARLNPNTALDVLSLTPRRTQLALREGSGVFDVGALASGELFEVATPGGAIDFMQPGLYQIGIGDDGNTVISVLAGSAQVVGLGGSGLVTQGQSMTLYASNSETTAAQNPSDSQAPEDAASVSQLDPVVSGSIVDDYYSYRYPKTYDGRYRDYKTYLSDPYYYDPYRRSASYQYISDDADVAGLDDLDGYGDWVDVPDHGHCWQPRVSSGWAPYRDGSWYNDQPLGLTWVSNERWGWAPYHYGRWSNVSGAWYWEPGETSGNPVYAPALVAFIPFPQQDSIGWVALGPRDPYSPRFYDQSYQPQYIGSNRNLNVTNIVNYNVAGAVTMVPRSRFGQRITPGNSTVAQQAFLRGTRPVADAYSVPGMSGLARNVQAGRPRMQLPLTARQDMNRRVMTSQNPVVPSQAANSVNAMKFNSVPEAQGKRKLQIANNRQTIARIQPNGLPFAPDPRPGQKSGQQGDNQQQQKANRKLAKQQAGIQQQQQAGSAQQQRSARKAAKQAAAPQQKQRQKAQRKAVRQAAAPQQKQQQKAQRKAVRQAAAPRQQQQKARSKGGHTK